MKVILYIATSADGFIADSDGGVNWLPSESTEDFGYEDLMSRISAIVMGSNSYEQVLGFGSWIWSDKITYVLTSRALKAHNDNIFIMHEDMDAFVSLLRLKHSNDEIWLLGGAQVVKSFAALGLIHECIITILPCTLGSGIKLELPYEDFTLQRSKNFAKGLVQKFYVKNIANQ